MLKFGAELILGSMLLPWLVWATVSIFSSQKADAVQESQMEEEKTLLLEVRSDVKEIKRR